MKMKQEKILYLICDLSRGTEGIEKALQAGVDYIQLREKDISSADYLKHAMWMREITNRYHTGLIINDRLDIALLSCADGIHLGQEDIPVDMARKVLGESKIIGATVKTVDQAVRAVQMGADYIGCGAWFATKTKQDTTPVMEEVYRDIKRNAAIPDVAVGGITVENCGYPLSLGASGLAVSAGILETEDIGRTVDGFRAKMGNYRLL